MRLLLCVGLSLLLHAAVAVLLVMLPPQEKVPRQKKQPQGSRAVRVVRAVEREAPADTPQEEEKPSEQLPFAKTSADTPQRRPEQPEYEGKRDTRAASETADRRSEAHAPSMHGEAKAELVTFDQDRQEGDLEHEGKKEPNPPQPPPVSVAVTETPQPPVPDAPAEGRPDAAPAAETEGKETQQSRAEATQSLTLTDNLSGHLKLRESETEIPEADFDRDAARQGMPGGTGSSPTAATPRPQRVYFDPSLADHMQKPGFRTHERRSRSSGRFVLGRGAALNVASTPRGMYEALIYRRIAHFWYMACDEHRGDIIPGTLVISLRITKRGQIDSMALIRRSGASISQQSFTFKAIRRASLPPMPPEVQADVVGPLMELIFEFNFD
jgi:hypothetical protein